MTPKGSNDYRFCDEENSTPKGCQACKIHIIPSGFGDARSEFLQSCHPFGIGLRKVSYLNEYPYHRAHGELPQKKLCGLRALRGESPLAPNTISENAYLPTVDLALWLYHPSVYTGNNRTYSYERVNALFGSRANM